jgi:hypothetical protein
LDHQAFDVKDTGNRIVALIGIFLVSLGCSYSANGYLMLTLTTFSQNPRIINRVWSLRFLLDAAIAALALLVPLHFFD